MQFSKILESMNDEIILKTQELIRIKSVESSPKIGMPFGEGVNDALKYVLNLCESLGFNTKNIDGYAGHAELGEGEEVVGILVHVDVVPEGDPSLWNHPPYAALIDNNCIFGRGSIDDKGPTIAAIYAMKALKESKVFFKKKIRIIFGTDEESGWECMKYYLKKEKSPDLAFTPDATYPVIYGEKGILSLKLKQKFNQIENSTLNLEYIKGGKFSNVVPDYCEALVLVNENKTDIYELFLNAIKDKNFDIDLLLDDNKIYFKSKGISAHALEPEKGKNAISQLIDILGVCDLFSNEVNSFIKFCNDKIAMEVDGKSLGCQMSDKDSGKLTLNVGIVNYKENQFELTVNIRYPITEKEENIINIINKNIENSKIELEIIQSMKPLFVSKDSILVKKLTNVYQKITNDNTPPLTFGGGTYARAMKNAVAFGAVFPNEPIMAHQTDEYIKIDSLLKNAEIMTHALYELACK